MGKEDQIGVLLHYHRQKRTIQRTKTSFQASADHHCSPVCGQIPYSVFFGNRYIFPLPDFDKGFLEPWKSTTHRFLFLFCHHLKRNGPSKSLGAYDTKRYGHAPKAAVQLLYSHRAHCYHSVGAGFQLFCITQVEPTWLLSSSTWFPNASPAYQACRSFPQAKGADHSFWPRQGTAQFLLH